MALPSLTLLGQSLLSGIFIGALYGLLGLGLSLSWGMLRQINLAHFALAFLGAYLTYQLAGAGMDPLATLAVIVPCFFALGALMHWLLRSLCRRCRPVPRAQLHAGAGTDLCLAGRGVRRGDARRTGQSAWTARRRNRDRSLGGADHGVHHAGVGAARVLLAPHRRAARAAGENLAMRG